MWNAPWTGVSFGFGPRAEHERVIFGKELNLFFHDAYGNRIDAGTEFFAALALDGAFKPVFLKVLAEGDKGSVSIKPRDIVEVGNRQGARYFVLMHNHPSGHPNPSSEDYYLTEVAGRLLSDYTHSKLWDHIITTANPEKFYSFRKSYPSIFQEPKRSAA